MNLKESFRHQSFLDALMTEAKMFIMSKENALQVTKTHHKNKANPDEENVVEDIISKDPFGNDDVMRFMEYLIDERYKLTLAINKAKMRAEFDIDAAIEVNKFRRVTADAIKIMLSHNPGTRIESGRAYKFNVEGNQMPYTYDIEVCSEDSYNRENAKLLFKKLTEAADKTSSDIDKVFVMTEVDYECKFDVNESFKDIMTEFLKSK